MRTGLGPENERRGWEEGDRRERSSPGRSAQLVRNSKSDGSSSSKRRRTTAASEERDLSLDGDCRLGKVNLERALAEGHCARRCGQRGQDGVQCVL